MVSFDILGSCAPRYMVVTMHFWDMLEWLILRKDTFYWISYLSCLLYLKKMVPVLYQTPTKVCPYCIIHHFPPGQACRTWYLSWSFFISGTIPYDTLFLNLIYDRKIKNNEESLNSLFFLELYHTSNLSYPNVMFRMYKRLQKFEWGSPLMGTICYGRTSGKFT